MAAKQETASPTFAARCPQGHVSYYDRRVVCSEHVVISRDPKNGDDRALLRCTTCGEEFTLAVDCRGYR